MPKPNDVLLPDHRAYTDAVEAMRSFHDAQKIGASPEEVERLRLIAESLFQSVTDYQLRAFGMQSGTIQ
ncbi:hypothetical protein D3C81_1975280 [compost metagenome]